MSKSIPRTCANRILASLPPKQFALLKPHLSAVDLPVRTQLEGRNKRIENIYFLEHGLASVVAVDTGERCVEVGIIGRESMTGLAVVMGDERSPYATFMQIAGDGQRISADKLRRATDRSVGLHRSLLHFAHAFHIQTTRTNLANARSKVKARLARWLLMAHDRIDGNDLQLTHEFISNMLGVRRAGVTAAVQGLEAAGLITSKRGCITIVDRRWLKEMADGSYAPLKGD
jgi:CRP-like cAMP-binding protein